jgi:hypothetical protein
MGDVCKKLNSFEKEILEFMFYEFGDIETSYQTIKQRLGWKFRVGRRTINEAMQSLVKAGCAERIGGYKNLKFRIIKFLENDVPTEIETQIKGHYYKKKETLYGQGQQL